MNQNEQMRDAFERFRDERNKELELQGHKPISMWHVTNAHWPTWQAAHKALAADPAPLVRLTDEEIWSDDGIMSVNADLGLTFDQIRKLAHAIMDAMERVNRRQLDQTPKTPSE